MPQPPQSSVSLVHKTVIWGWQNDSRDNGTCHQATIPRIPHGERQNKLPKVCLACIPWHVRTHTHTDVIKKYLCILLLLGRRAHYSLFQARSFLNIHIQFPHLQSLTACWVVFSSSSPYSAQPQTWDFSLISPDTLNSPRYIISSQQAAKIQHPLTTPT